MKGPAQRFCPVQRANRNRCSHIRLVPPAASDRAARATSSTTQISRKVPLKRIAADMRELAANIDPNLAAHGTPAIAEGEVLRKLEALIPIQRGIEKSVEMADIVCCRRLIAGE